MRNQLSRILQFSGFVGMLIGMFTTYMVLKAAVALYLVGFLVYLTIQRDTDAPA